MSDVDKQQQLEELRKHVRERLAKRIAARQLATSGHPPRYDEVYFEGLRWLDSLAHSPDDEAN
jgi:hypothetical protein